MMNSIDFQMKLRLVMLVEQILIYTVTSSNSRHDQIISVCSMYFSPTVIHLLDFKSLHLFEK